MIASFRELLAPTVKPLIVFIKRIWIEHQLRNLKYLLDGIAQTRANDREVERLAHRQQALLVSKLYQLEK